MFVMDEDLRRFRPGTLFVDVSCDEGMGFEWARPTSFAEPMFSVGEGLHYYAVDHSPSYLWNSATWENSEALLAYLPVVMAGAEAWDADETIRRAIEIREGVVQTRGSSRSRTARRPTRTRPAGPEPRRRRSSARSSRPGARRASPRSRSPG